MLRQMSSIASTSTRLRVRPRSNTGAPMALLSTLLITLAVVAFSAVPAQAFGNAAIADQAERRVGQTGGQCLQFVHNMIVAAGGPRLAFGYNDATYQAQWAKYARPVNGLKNARRGDIIQWYHSRRGPHTAIVVRPGANPELVDSNFGVRNRVRKGSFSSRNGYFFNQHKIWRVGSVNVPKPKGNAPIGHFDSATGQAGGAARVRGWTIDPDVPSRSTGVHVYVDGAAGSGARGIDIGLANLARRDVMKAYKSRWRNVGARHGFDKVVTGLTPGVHTLFVYAIDSGGGGGNRLISSKKVTVPAPVSPAPTPQMPVATGKVLLVDNRVTNGSTQMREDPTPVRLTTKPWKNCGSRGCNIVGTERRTGQTYDKAICQTTGERTTNGNDGSSVDDRNPGLFTSTRYYKVKLSNGKAGFVSEVWINKKDRGGLGLPKC